ncbi:MULTISPECIES: hypothetical protein [unclassified Wenzhouxiangella]|uniref:hypothetical protein n=1 Tax=unclassified Wenzhouxiangella TaxID=2613841 RepID=UPI0011C043B7|nr:MULTISPECIES: hypothetical protein [unclassified Wenzhouxiangella]
MSEPQLWLHPEDNADQWDGFNDSGIETFSGSPITHLAREIIQNSIDAKTKDPVEVHFKLEKRSISIIPDLDQFKKTFAACSENASDEGKKAQVFFDNAIKLLNEDKISVLEISDFNTNGVEGPCENGKPFYALLKARGQSKKGSVTAAGSFGIGKFAPYAVSNLRTVFVSTVYQNEAGELEQLSQGKSILMSHDLDGQRRQGTGFFGKPKLCQPLSGNPNIPSQLLRSNGEQLEPHMLGTKLAILGFRESKNWEHLLALSVAINFFAALIRGELVVKIGDEICLDASTVSDFLDPDAFAHIIRGTDITKSNIAYSASYLHALRSDQAFASQSEMRALGHVELRLSVEEDLPRRIAVLRNGMFITDRLEGLRRFGGFKEFAGVIECQSDEGNSLLRGMEPPRHDKFEPERLPTEKEQTQARKALEDLAGWVREMLQRHAKDEVADITEVEELAEYFADDSDTTPGEEGDEVDPLGNVVFSPRPIRRSRPRTHPGDSDEGNSSEEGPNPGGGGSEGQGGGDGQGGAGDGEGGNSSPRRVGAQVEVSHVRMIGRSSQSINLAFTPWRSCKAKLVVSAAGADSDVPIEIESTSRGNVKKGHIEFDAIAGDRSRFEIELGKPAGGAIKVEVYEI